MKQTAHQVIDLNTVEIWSTLFLPTVIPGEDMLSLLALFRSYSLICLRFPTGVHELWLRVCERERDAGVYERQGDFQLRAPQRSSWAHCLGTKTAS